MNSTRFKALTGYQFKQQDLLQQALTHRSHSRSRSNERLEFLGDSVVNLAITSHIYRRFEAADEGDLSRVRAMLVRQSTLAQIARSIDLGEAILLGGGELKSGGFRRASILADALEAVIGAVYLDSDYPRAEAVVLKLFADRLDGIDIQAEFKDPKTRLQEYLQSRQQALPIYTVEETAGKAHSRVFTVSCSLEQLDLRATGSGSSRKKAEQQAASKLLESLQA